MFYTASEKAWLFKNPRIHPPKRRRSTPSHPDGGNDPEHRFVLKTTIDGWEVGSILHYDKVIDENSCQQNR